MNLLVVDHEGSARWYYIKRTAGLEAWVAWKGRATFWRLFRLMLPLGILEEELIGRREDSWFLSVRK